MLRTEVPGVSHNESSKYFDRILAWFDSVGKGTHVSGEAPAFWKKK